MTILVIDDAATVRGFHRQILEQHGFTVDEAANGIEGLERVLAAEQPYELLLVDINMPQMDGYQMTREVRSKSQMQDVPIIVISTEADDKDKVAAFESGANSYMIKPIKPEHLFNKVNLIIGASATTEGDSARG